MRNALISVCVQELRREIVVWNVLNKVVISSLVAISFPFNSMESANAVMFFPTPASISKLSFSSDWIRGTHMDVGRRRSRGRETTSHMVDYGNEKLIQPLDQVNESAAHL